MNQPLGDALRKATKTVQERSEADRARRNSEVLNRRDAESRHRADLIIETLPGRLVSAAQRGQSYLDITKDITGSEFHYTLFDETMLATARKIDSWAHTQRILCHIGNVDNGVGSDPGPPSQTCYLSWENPR